MRSFPPQFCQDIDEDVLWVVRGGGQHVSAITNKLIFDLITQNYYPYDSHAEFSRGFSACQAGDLRNPHEADSISARAWNRGVEAAIMFKRATGG
jgi:hypothetical protein